MVHNFVNKASRVARFSVVHACTKSVYEVHEKLCTRILNSFSPVYICYTYTYTHIYIYNVLYGCISMNTIQAIKYCKLYIADVNLIFV